MLVSPTTQGTGTEILRFAQNDKSILSHTLIRLAYSHFTFPSVLSPQSSVLNNYPATRLMFGVRRCSARPISTMTRRVAMPTW
jgi:hypothetical protein